MPLRTVVVPGVGVRVGDERCGGGGQGSKSGQGRSEPRGFSGQTIHGSGGGGRNTRGPHSSQERSQTKLRLGGTEQGVNRISVIQQLVQALFHVRNQTSTDSHFLALRLAPPHSRARAPVSSILCLQARRDNIRNYALYIPIRAEGDGMPLVTFLASLPPSFELAVSRS